MRGMTIRNGKGSSPECRAQPVATRTGPIFILIILWVMWLDLPRVTRRDPYLCSFCINCLRALSFDSGPSPDPDLVHNFVNQNYGQIGFDTRDKVRRALCCREFHYTPGGRSP